jgi:hypothetical protein
LFLASFVLIRGNDIGRRVPILLSPTAISTCQGANPSVPVFGSDPYGLTQQGTGAIAFFYTPGSFGECTMNFLNGSWHPQARLNTSTTSTEPIVIGIYGAQQPDRAKIIVGGLVEPSIQKLELVLSNGSRSPVTIHDHLFYAWILNPVSSPASATALKLLGSSSHGSLVYSVRLSTITSSST